MKACISDDGRVIELIEVNSKEKMRVKIKRKLSNVKDWCIANKELIIGFGIPIIAGCSKTILYLAKGHKQKRRNDDLKDLKELYIYDRSLGHYWKLKRPLSNSELLEIDRRRKNGERLSEILESIKVLK